MDVDPLSGSETPSELEELSSYEKQKATLQTYIDSLPYPCESLEEMHQALEDIVGNIAICAKTRNWRVMSTWDHLVLSYVSILPFTITTPNAYTLHVQMAHASLSNSYSHPCQASKVLL